jgi:hypothetical protein
MGVGTGGIGQKLTSSGGITPEQQALAQYHFGQGAIKAESDFSRIPMSTNLTQAIGGARAGAAQEIGQMSAADAAAQAKFLNQQTGNLTQGVGAGLGSIAGKGG